MNFKTGLTRMIAIDGAFSTGGITEFPFEDHLVLQGRNGVSKTSHMEMITLFLGTPFQKLNQNLTFRDFHFPHAGSAIIFEYLNMHCEPCIVILFRDKDRINWRFAQTPYVRDLVVADGLLLGAERITERMDEMGVIYTRKIDTLPVYLSILCGDKVTVQDGASIRHWQERFAIAEPVRGHPGNHLMSLGNLGPIMLATIGKTGIYKNLKSTILEYIGDETIKVLSRNSADIRETISEIRTLNDIDRKASRFDAASALIISHKAHLAEMEEISVGAKLFISKAETDQKEAQERLASTRSNRSEAREKRSSDHAAYLQSLSEIRAEMGRIVPDIQSLDQRKRIYDEQDVNALRNLVAILPSMRSRKSVLLNHREALKGQVREIEEAWRDRFEDVKTTAVQQESALASASKTTLEESAEQIEATREEFERKRDRLRGRCDQEIAEINQAVERASAKVAVIRAGQDVVPVEIADKISSLEEDLRNKETARRDAEKSLQIAQNTLAEKKSAERDASDRAQGADLLAETKRAEVGRTRKALSPVPGTFLAWLGKETPSWGQDIGRVIRPELLGRTDLSPSLVDGTGLFGIQIDLSVLAGNEPDESDPVRLEAKLEALERALRDVETACVTVTKAHKDASAARKDAEESLNRAEVFAQATQRRENNALMELQAARRDKDEVLRSLREDRDQRLAEAEADLVKWQADRAALQKRLRKDLDDLTASERGARNAISEKASATVRKNDRTVSEIRDALKVTLQGMEARKRQEISDQGVDQESSEHLDKDIRDNDAMIKRAVDAEHALEMREQWMSEEWPRRATLQEHLDGFRSRQDRLEEVEKSAVHDHAKIEEIMAKEEAAVQEDLTGIERDLEACQTILMKTADLEPARSAVTDFDPVLHLGRLNEILTSERAAILKVNSLCREIVPLFTSHGSKKTLYYIDEMKEENPEIGYAWLEKLVHWYEVERSPYLRKIRVSVDITHTDTENFIGQVNRFNLSVRRFSKKLNESLSAQVKFPYLNSVQIEIHSLIGDHGLVQAATTFKTEIDIWKARSSERDTPDDKMIEALIQVERAMSSYASSEIALEDLIDMRGSVIEDGTLKKFRNDKEMEKISSTGLTRIFFVMVYAAFMEIIRNGRPINLPFMIDEVDSIDPTNRMRLIEFIRSQNLTMVAACPESATDMMGIGNLIMMTKDNGRVRTFNMTKAD